MQIWADSKILYSNGKCFRPISFATALIRSHPSRERPSSGQLNFSQRKVKHVQADRLINLADIILRKMKSLMIGNDNGDNDDDGDYENDDHDDDNDNDKDDDNDDDKGKETYWHYQQTATC